MYKAITAVLVVILISVVAFDLYTIYQSEKKPPLPTPAPLPSIVPTTDSPRVADKEVQVKHERAQVEIRNYTAIPNVLKIKTNTTVTWTNFDKDPHQIIGDRWKSQVLKEKEKFSQAFEKVGNFPYKDPQNPQLTGIIIVSIDKGSQ